MQHLTTPKHVTLDAVPGERTAQPLHFTGSRGERLSVTVLEHDIIRVQHQPDGSPRLDRTWIVCGPEGDTPREGRRRDDLSPFTLPDVAVTVQNDDVHAQVVHVQTAVLQLAIHTGAFRITWADAAGRSFAADLAVAPYTYDGRGDAVYHYLESRPNEHYYGFGEKAGPLDKRGLRLKLDAADALGYNAEHSDPLYKHWPFYITFDPQLQIAYGLLYDTCARGEFDMGKAVNALRGAAFRSYRAEAGDLDYYLIYGPSIPEVLEKLARLIGRPALPPRWTLGYLGSTMHYTEAPDAQEQLKQFVDLCAAHDIPCDMFHLSSGYTTDAQGRRSVFTWNRDKVPQPDAMAAHFHEAGIHVAANIKPYLLTTHPYFDDLAAAGGFIKSEAGDEPEINQFWSGGAFEYAEGAYVDFTSAAGFDWWKARVTDALLAYGIDAMWNDNNEFEVRDDAAQGAGFGEPLPVQQMRPLLTLLMGRASYEATQAFRPDERPFLLTRSGCPGIQRYAQTWSGDNATSWHTLKWNIPMGLSQSMSGMPNCGHDVGGFDGPKPDPELFVRWVQNGIFHPRFTIHSWNTDGSVNEPWMYPAVLPLIRDAIRFRYRLIPYLYTLLFEASQTGHPIIRPLVYHFPHDPRCHSESFEFMLGPNLLVASVWEPGLRARPVYLPQGTDWHDFYTGECHYGGQVIDAAAPLDRMPLFVPAGGIVPLGKPMQHVGAASDNVREAFVFPSLETGRSSFTLIEDDGISLGYQRGETSVVTLEVTTTSDAVALAVQVERAGYPLPYDAVTFLLPPGETRTIEAADAAVFRGSDGWQRVTVPVPKL